MSFPLSFVNTSLLWFGVAGNLLLSLALFLKLNELSVKFILSGVGMGLKPGTLAPEFSAETLDGDTVTSETLSLEDVLLVFFSPHCQPCLEEMPALLSFAAKAKRWGTQVILVNLDGTRAEVAAVVEKFQIQIPLLLAPTQSNRFAAVYQCEITPSYTHIQQGRIASAGIFDHSALDLLRQECSSRVCSELQEAVPMA